jgi:hypothetical protein
MGARQGAWERATGISVVVGPYKRAIGRLIGVIVPREIAASVAPAHRNSKFATLTGGLAHDVSNLLGVGRHLGSQLRAKTSITRAPFEL